MGLQLELIYSKLFWGIAIIQDDTGSCWVVQAAGEEGPSQGITDYQKIYHCTIQRWYKYQNAKPCLWCCQK